MKRFLGAIADWTLTTVGEGYAWLSKKFLWLAKLHKGWGQGIGRWGRK